jgi:hypothetical protein
MLHKTSFLAILMAIFTLFSLASCDKEKQCQKKIIGSWESNSFDGPYEDEEKISLRLDDDFTGKITFEYEDGSSESYKIEDWSVNEDCDRFQFTDEDGDEGDFEIIRLEDDRLTIEGDLYDDDYEIRFKRR